MKPLLQTLRTRAARLTLAAALCLGAGFAAAADKKPDEKKDKAAEKKPAEPKAGGDPKAAAKEAAPVVTNTPPILVAFPKAVFSTALDAGRDPFFPGSKRRVPKPPEPPKPPPPVAPPTNIPVVIKVPDPGTTNLPPAGVTNPAPVVPVVPVTLIGSANLSLRGITATKTRRIAEVNTGARSYSFLKGDTQLIRLPGDRQLKVRCLDIRERSAIFQAEGEPETKELFLREGVY